MNAFQQKYSKEIEKVLTKYPAERKQSAVMPLLYLAQREGGFVTKQDMFDIGEILEMTSTEVASIVGFYTLYHEKPGGKIRIQVCNDLSCALRGADDFLEQLCEAVGIRPGETTADGLISIEAVMCLASCDKAPMFQTQSADGIEYHENMTVENTLGLIETWKKQGKGG
ncbi:MAG: NAD(P)H-dependent oxidoreductase subunit E [Anaerolineaceae bacterium]|nr:NAD(P)H-dependent oxidoreductase subunit E [Anaerolineaceae bacterium]